MKIKILILMFLSLFIIAKERKQIDLENRVDNEPTQEEIKLLKLNESKRINNDDNTNENDNQFKKKKKKSGNTKSASDYDYLRGYNLSNATYSRIEDKDNYKFFLDNNQFVPQGLSIDNSGNLLITMYHKVLCASPFNGEACSYKRSIVVRYNSGNKIIKNIYTFDNLNIGAHLGGIGYYKTEDNDEYIFLPYGSTLRIYKIYSDSTQEHKKSYNTIHIGSAVSTSYGYLWMANYKDSDDQIAYLTGYKIIYQNGEIFLGNQDYYPATDALPNYWLKQPKWYIQGLYCDSNPEEEKRLKFYFTASANKTYVYQAVVVPKDINNNGVIEYYNDEYYWESDYTPYGYNSGSFRKLPDGGEGIVMKDGELYMLNEGATDYYCAKWGWWGTWDDIDCAREILVIDPVYPWGHTHPWSSTSDIFPSGSIRLTGSGLNNVANKVAIVFAQNKKGKLYYSIGSFEGANKDLMYLNKPNNKNPVGRQYPYGEKPSVFVEDIKAIYLMNLNNYDSNDNDSDDFYLSYVKVTFDERDVYNNGESGSLYDEKVYIGKSFGDDNTNSSSGDKEAMFLSFDFRWGSNDMGERLFYNQGSYQYYLFQNIFLELRDCYDDAYSSKYSCRLSALSHMKTYIANHTWWFMNLLNKYIDRFYNIQYRY